jgi:hypothetical protein
MPAVSHWGRLLGLLVSSCLLTGLLAGSAAASVAPGCTAKTPTFVGGTLVGYPDGHALDAHIGVSVGYHDAAGRLHVVLPDGSPNPSTNGDYSWVDRLNPTVPATGTTDSAAQRTWGMCVWGGVTVFYAEMYPKAPVDSTHDQAHQATDKSRYGSSAYYAGTVAGGQRLNVALRAPVTWQAGQGNTGGVQGYITYRGVPVPAANVTRVRAFPGPGATCGVEGYSAAADQLLTAAGPTRTYYRLDYLVGGQCGAAAQHYAFQVNCHAVCGATDRLLTRDVGIVKGRTPRLDVAF